MLRVISAGLLVAWLAILPAVAEQVDLRVLAWPGYADSDIVTVFEKRYQVKVKVSYVTNDDDMWLRIGHQQGADFDVFAVNSAELQRYINANLTQPLNPKLLPNVLHQRSRFKALQSIPGATRGDAVYAVPYTYSEMGLIYNLAMFKQPPTSWQVLWDPRYRAQILAYNGSSHNYSLAAMVEGVANPFQLDETQFRQATERLVALRRNVLTFYASPEEALDYFTQENIALMFANYGAQQVKMLTDAGAQVGYVIPREGALAWLDCWVLSAGMKNSELAHQWINYTLEPWVSERLTQRQGLANTIVQDPRSVTEDKIIWLQAVEDQQRRSQVWQLILSGKNMATME
ncbi:MULTISPECIES: extracellular solute-binding protein [unclassified Agarivorans]|uniref:extracellular solute-binding protein n=1 Tax=unclassified Agarivorans TaxID=2636026 RepID=UPI003D7DCA0A